MDYMSKNWNILIFYYLKGYQPSSLLDIFPEVLNNSNNTHLLSFWPFMQFTAKAILAFLIYLWQALKTGHLNDISGWALGLCQNIIYSVTKDSIILLLFSFILCISLSIPPKSTSIYVHSSPARDILGKPYNSLCIYTIFSPIWNFIIPQAVLLNDLSYWSSDNKEEENL